MLLLFLYSATCTTSNDKFYLSYASGRDHEVDAGPSELYINGVNCNFKHDDDNKLDTKVTAKVECEPYACGIDRGSIW